MDVAILLVGLGLPGMLIWRYRAIGLLIAIPLAWGILALLLLTPGDGPRADKEFMEEWPAQSGLVSVIWCLGFSAVATFARWAFRRTTEHGRLPAA